MYEHTPSPFTWMVSRSSTRQTLLDQACAPKEEYEGENQKGLQEGAWLKGRKSEREERLPNL